MSGAGDIVEVAELDFVLEPASWPFAERNAVAIASHWAQLRKEKPAAYNGRVLLLGRRELKPRGDGALRMRGAYFETDYADFVAWRAFGFPGEQIDNCFSMAALQCAEGAFLLGEMAQHTLHAGQIYFPAGTPDPSDVFGGKVDLDASARRELFEETGIRPETAVFRRSWTVVFGERRIACMKLVTLPMAAEEAKAEVEAFLARDPHAELSRMHIVRDERDIDEARTPSFVSAYLRWALSER